MLVKKVCILGGSGFIGRYITHRLVAQGIHVHIPTRHPQRHRDLKVMPLVTLSQHNVHDPVQLSAVIQGCDAVINLIGILNEKGSNGKGFHFAHVELAKKVLKACEQHAVKRLLHMSALNADPGGPSHYLRSKGEAENQVHQFSQKMAVTSFRPSIVFGAEDGFFNLFAGILRITPIAFPLVKAKARFQPVYVGDVADAFVNALSDSTSFGKRYELCGPKVYRFKELLEYVGKLSGHRRLIVPLPDALGRLQATLLGMMPGKPMSMDNFNSLSIDSVCSSQCAPCPTSLDSVLPHYLGGDNLQERYQRARRQANR